MRARIVMRRVWCVDNESQYGLTSRTQFNMQYQQCTVLSCLLGRDLVNMAQAHRKARGARSTGMREEI